MRLDLARTHSEPRPSDKGFGTARDASKLSLRIDTGGFMMHSSTPHWLLLLHISLNMRLAFRVLTHI